MCESDPQPSLYDILSGFTSLTSIVDTLDPSMHAPPIPSPSVSSVDVSRTLSCTHCSYANHLSHECPYFSYPSEPTMEYVYPYDTVPEPTSTYYLDIPNSEWCEYSSYSWRPDYPPTQYESQHDVVDPHTFQQTSWQSCAPIHDQFPHYAPHEYQLFVHHESDPFVYDELGPTPHTSYEYSPYTHDNSELCPPQPLPPPSSTSALESLLQKFILEQAQANQIQTQALQTLEQILNELECARESDIPVAPPIIAPECDDDVSSCGTDFECDQLCYPENLEVETIPWSGSQVDNCVDLPFDSEPDPIPPYPPEPHFEVHLPFPVKSKIMHESTPIELHPCVPEEQIHPRLAPATSAHHFPEIESVIVSTSPDIDHIPPSSTQ